MGEFLRSFLAFRPFLQLREGSWGGARSGKVSIWALPVLPVSKPAKHLNDLAFLAAWLVK